MSITQIGNIAFINQNTAVVSTKVADNQARSEQQNIASANILDEEKEAIEKVRPTEETYKIDPKNEHEKKRSKQEQHHSDMKQQDENAEDDEIPPSSSEHLLDIKV
jgi:hypothetical protein